MALALGVYGNNSNRKKILVPFQVEIKLFQYFFPKLEQSFSMGTLSGFIYAVYRMQYRLRIAKETNVINIPL